MPSSDTLYTFCCNDDEATALLVLEMCDDIDVLYGNQFGDGVILHAAVEREQTKVLSAMLQYFENKQFPNKDESYETAHDRLIEILEECSECVNSTSQTYSIISAYIGSDIARLGDVEEAEELVPSRQHSSEQGSVLTANMLPAHDQTNNSTNFATSSCSSEDGGAIDTSLTGELHDYLGQNVI